MVVEGPGGQKGVQRTNGTFLFPTGSFTQVQYVGGNGLMYGITQERETVVFNSDGKTLSTPYDALNSYYHTNIIMAEKDKLFGLIDTLGQVIKPPQYKNLRRVRRGVYKGTFPDGREELIQVEESDGLTDADRKKALSNNSKKMKDRIIIIAKADKKGYLLYYGFTTMDGDTLLAPDRYASNHLNISYEQQAMIATDSETGKQGLFDKDANIVIPFEYDKIWHDPMENGYVLAQKGNQYSTINLDGSLRASMRADKMYPMRAHPYQKAIIDNKQFLYNDQMTRVLPEAFDHIRDPANKNWTMLSKNKQKGFFSLKSGKYTPPAYKKISTPIRYDVFGVATGEKFALFNVHRGDLLTDSIYHMIQKAGPLYKGVLVKKDSVLKDSTYRQVEVTYYQMLDSEGRTLYGPVSKRIHHAVDSLHIEKLHEDSIILHHFFTGRQRLVTGNDIKFYPNNVIRTSRERYYFTDELFNDGTARSFEYLSDKITEGVRLFKQNGKYGLIHQQKVVAEAEFQELKDIKDGMIKAKLDGKWGILKNPYATP